MNLTDRMYNITNALSRTSLYTSFIGLLQRMTNTGDKSYAELEDIKVLLQTTVKQNEEIIKALRMRRWK